MKKYLSVLLVLSLALGLVACTKPAQQNPTNPTGTMTATEPTTPAALSTSTESASNALYRDVIVQAEQTVTTKISGCQLELSDSITNPQPDTDYQYKVRGAVKDKNGGYNDSLVQKLQGETELWSATIQNFYPNGFTVVSGGLLVYGRDRLVRDPYLVKFSDSGQFLWMLKLENVEISGVSSVVENADGSYAVFSAGWEGAVQCLCLNQVSAEGKVLFFKTNKIGENYFCCAARVGDDYWLHIGRDEFTVVRMDKEGNIIDTLSFGEENANYYIFDMMEYNGKVYMSLASSPKIAEKNPDSYNTQELYDVMALSKEITEEAQKEWEAAGGGHNLELENKKYDITERIQDHYTAMLLVCDASTGKPLEFYSVKASIGGKLAINQDGTLLWCVKNIEKAYRTPLSCSNYWLTECKVYNCVLDAAGKPISVEKTDASATWYSK